MHENYCIYKHGTLWEVLCKCCGTPIRRMLPVEDLTVIRESRGKVIIQERLDLRCLANYREVLIEFDDGSKHVTPLCAFCAEQHQHDVETLTKCYGADKLEWHTHGGAPFHPKERKAVKVLRIAHVIEGSV